MYASIAEMPPECFEATFILRFPGIVFLYRKTVSEEIKYLLKEILL